MSVQELEGQLNTQNAGDSDHVVFDAADTRQPFFSSQDLGLVIRDVCSIHLLLLCRSPEKRSLLLSRQCFDCLHLLTFITHPPTSPGNSQSQSQQIEANSSMSKSPPNNTVATCQELLQSLNAQEGLTCSGDLHSDAAKTGETLLPRRRRSWRKLEAQLAPLLCSRPGNVNKTNPFRMHSRRCIVFQKVISNKIPQPCALSLALTVNFNLLLVWINWFDSMHCKKIKLITRLQRLTSPNSSSSGFYLTA